MRSWIVGVRSALAGGADEVGRETVLTSVVDAVWRLATHGARGAPRLPPSVCVRIAAPEPSRGAVERLVAAPDFDDAIDRALANRVLASDGVPLRRYEVVAGARLAAVAEEAPALCLRLVVEGGDRDGAVTVIDAWQREATVGRGAWHGPDRRLRNDVVITDSAAFVSRRAARLRRRGAAVEVEALDQGDCLAVRSAAGPLVRPSRSPGGWARVAPGDALELDDGDGQVLRVWVRAQEVE